MREPPAREVSDLQTFSVVHGSVSRRGLIRGLVALFASAGCARSAAGRKPAAPAPVVRISRGSFAPDQYEAVASRLDAARTSLIPAIRRLTGCLHYLAAIDRESNSMVNVSVWRSKADAMQMQTLGPMLALAEQFTREGVSFERPIINYETLWTLDDA